MSAAEEQPENPQIGWRWYPGSRTPKGSLHDFTSRLSWTVDTMLSKLGVQVAYEAPPEPSPIKPMAEDGYWDLLYAKRLHDTPQILGMSAVRELYSAGHTAALEHPDLLAQELAVDERTVAVYSNYLQIAPEELPSGKLWVPEGLAEQQNVGLYTEFWDNSTL